MLSGFGVTPFGQQTSLMAATSTRGQEGRAVAGGYLGFAQQCKGKEEFFYIVIIIFIYIKISAGQVLLFYFIGSMFALQFKITMAFTSLSKSLTRFLFNHREFKTSYYCLNVAQKSRFNLLI